MVKIVRKLNRKVDKKTYYKYLVPLSTKQMDQLGWDENTQVLTKVYGKKMIVEKSE